MPPRSPAAILRWFAISLLRSCVHPFLAESNTPQPALLAKNAGLVDQRAQCFELLLAWRRNRFHFLRGLHLEAGISLDVFYRYTWKYHRKPRFERIGIKVENAFRRHDPLRSAA